MLLSIVMMVKNEERYLDKTLYALNDLRNKLIQEERTTDAVDEVLLKALDAPEKKRYFKKDSLREDR